MQDLSSVNWQQSNQLPTANSLTIFMMRGCNQTKVSSSFIVNSKMKPTGGFFKAQWLSGKRNNSWIVVTVNDSSKYFQHIAMQVMWNGVHFNSIFFFKYHNHIGIFSYKNDHRLMNFKLKISISLHYSLCDSQIC